MPDLTWERLDEIIRLYPLPARELAPDEFNDVREKYRREMDRADELLHERYEV